MIVKDDYYKRARDAMSERRRISKTSGGYTVADAAEFMQQFDEIRHMVMANAAARGVDLNRIIIVRR